ncbi:MAG: 30S ribosomal protein S15 [Parcubacteria group bacterium GW2011_GWA2_44_12]|nr:MAG: 30S ribosomal protein S15 [Parcubacteria group bacterium GW2011_GWA2_44_12]
MLNKTVKNKIITKFKTHETDTGSSEVQIAILTHEVNELSKHLKTHRKDFSSRRGLIKKVSQRRRLLHYLERENKASFEKIIQELKIRYKNKMPAILKEENDVREEESVDTHSDEEETTE